MCGYHDAGDAMSGDCDGAPRWGCHVSLDHDEWGVGDLGTISWDTQHGSAAGAAADGDDDAAAAAVGGDDSCGWM